MKFIKSLLGASAPDQNQYKPDFPWMPLKQMEYLDNILEDNAATEVSEDLGTVQRSGRLSSSGPDRLQSNFKCHRG